MQTLGKYVSPSREPWDVKYPPRLLQSLPVELQVWLDGILLLSEAVLRDENCQAQAKDVLQCALGMLESLQQRNKNEAPRVDHARAILRARYSLFSPGLLPPVYIGKGKY